VGGQRGQVLASVGTRLALGAYPLVFILAFGWAYGKAAFDVAAAASNWANYLNVLLLGGFVLVPPAVARLRSQDRRSEDAQLVRDHIALERWLVVFGVVAAAILWLSVDRAFPLLAQRAGASLAIWFVLFAVLALAQLPMTLWLGAAQAAGQYLQAFACIALPRLIALVVLLLGAGRQADATWMLGATVVVVVAGQSTLAHIGRRALRAIDTGMVGSQGAAGRVLAQNLSAGAIGLVGTLVTIVPVTIIGRLLPEEVGHAHVAVSLSNSIGAVLVAALFPLSLALAERTREPGGIWRHCLRVARLVGMSVAALLAAGWVAFPVCSKLSDQCTTQVATVASLVVVGAGLRLASLGVFHVAVYEGRPHLALLSATVEAIAVVLITWLLVGSWLLLALGIGFLVGGGLRLLIALGIEARALGRGT